MSQPEDATTIARRLARRRLPRDPFGIAAGTERTGHRDDQPPHPAWCDPAECTANDPRTDGVHVSTWRVTEPDRGGEVLILARLFNWGTEPMQEPPQVEIVWVRWSSATSIEGYELTSTAVSALATTLAGLHAVMADERHWLREVTG